MTFETKGERLRYLRENKGLTLDEVGKFIGKGRQNIYKYEHNIITNIPSDIVSKLAELYGSTPSFIMGWSKYPYRNPEISSVSWAGIFIENLQKVWEESELNGSVGDYEEENGSWLSALVSDVLEGKEPLTFPLACDLADKLGVSMDALIGREEYQNAALEFENGVGDLDRQLINLLKVISLDQKRFLLAQLKLLVNQNGESKEKSF